MPTLSKATYRFNAILIKIPLIPFRKWGGGGILKYIREHKNILPELKVYYKAIIIKTAWYWNERDAWTHRTK